MKQIEDNIQIQNAIRNTIITTIITNLFFIIFSILVGTIILKSIISPILRFIKSAEKIATGESTNIQYLTNENDEKEVKDLVNAFGVMTTELQENLNEASRQKKQIETILLHMTDGIIAVSYTHLDVYERQVVFYTTSIIYWL